MALSGQHSLEKICMPRSPEGSSTEKSFLLSSLQNDGNVPGSLGLTQTAGPDVASMSTSPPLPMASHMDLHTPSGDVSAALRATNINNEIKSRPRQKDAGANTTAYDKALSPISPASGSTNFRFDPNFCSSSLEIMSPLCLHCPVNASRFSQGVCFLEPAVQRGERAEVRFSLDNKPGRMRYFLGVARKQFATDGSDALLRNSGWSLENLYAGPHKEGAPCTVKAPPLFHTGSIVTLVVDLRDAAKPHLEISVDSTGANFRVELDGKRIERLFLWVSLYNRFAQFSLL
jgi:hypothetical protein